MQKEKRSLCVPSACSSLYNYAHKEVPLKKKKKKMPTKNIVKLLMFVHFKLNYPCYFFEKDISISNTLIVGRKL